MRKAVSLVVTAALVMSMGVAAFAATPSKTVADAVDAAVTTTVEGSGTVSFEEPASETAKAEAAAQTASALQNVAAKVDLKALTSATAEETVEVAAAKTVTVAQTTLADTAMVAVEMDSQVVTEAYKNYVDGSEIAVLVAIPTVDETGKTVYTYVRVPAVVKGGKVQVKLTGAQLKSFGKSFTLMALTRTAK